MATRGERWAFWLESEMERKGWQRADIPKRSRRKSNGRPIIDASRVSEWLNNNEAPGRPDILLELARIFDVPAAVVLNAAGWLPDHELAGASERTAINDFADAVRNDPHLIPEARQHLLNQYQLLLRIASPVGPHEQSPEAEALARARATNARIRAPHTGQQRPTEEEHDGTGRHKRGQAG